MLHQSRRIWIVGLITALLVGSLLFFPGAAVPEASAQVPTPQPLNRTVSVNGSGAVRAVPDTGIVVLGVTTDAETASVALDQNNEQMEALMTALRGAGIAAADIQTRTIQLYPRYAPQPTATPTTPGSTTATSRVEGYTATNTVAVTVRDLDNLGTLLDEAVEAGSNQIESISFDVQDKNEVLDQAREAAMADAKRKAEQLATLADSELGQVVTINEFSSFPLVVQERAAIAFDSAAGVPVSPGSQMINVEVQVTWELQ